MADTPSVKKYVDYAQQQIDEQAIADKFNAATAAQYAVQREQNRQAENQFYNQMYNTQQTAMDTIRKSNAAAVSTGASRGVQAANELSAILGLEQESVAGATELAQANRQTAQEETAAVLENVLKAYQQAVTERQQLVQQGIESASVDVQQDANQVQREANELQKQQIQSQTQQTQSDIAGALVSAAENGTSKYLSALTGSGKDYANVPSAEGAASLDAALSGMSKDIGGSGENLFVKDDWAWENTGEGKYTSIKSHLQQICAAYGIPYSTISSEMSDLEDTASAGASWASGTNKSERAEKTNTAYKKVLAKLRTAYQDKITAAAGK